jgi:hypothetical protein
MSLEQQPRAVVNERRRRGFAVAHTSNGICAPPFEALGAREDALGNSVELIRRGGA